MKKLVGLPAAPGLAVGKVRILAQRTMGISRSVEAPHREKALYEAARILAKDELLDIAEGADEKDATIFLFQKMVLDDDGFNRVVFQAIEKEKGAVQAVEEATNTYIKKLRATKDDYISERAIDLHDVCRRVVNILDGTPRERIQLKEPAIIVAHEIMPSDLMMVKKTLIKGFVTSAGSAQSHAAIIARTMGIPAVVSVGNSLFDAPNGTVFALDGGSGEIYIDPDEATKARFLHRIALTGRRYLSLEKLKQLPCLSKDGTKFTLLANCSSEKDIAYALERGAEGIGLLRSEYLFMNEQLPTEESQFQFYKNCLVQAGGLPVTIRTFDIGADKEVAGISMPKEENPALGLRGLRLSFERTELFETQITALLKAGVYGNLKVMFPMVTELSDFERAMEIVEKMQEKLEKSKEPYAKTIEWGVMIETPSAALQAEELASKVDFFSIGTNDLTQYTLAADRTNTAVAKYYNPSSPAVMQLIKMTLQAAEKHGCNVSVCGESAADETTAAAYAEMGIRHFSVSGTALLNIKEALMEVTITKP